MLIFNESIATRFPCSFVVDNVNLEKNKKHFDNAIKKSKQPSKVIVLQ